MERVSIRKKMYSLVLHILSVTLGVSIVTATIILTVLCHRVFRDGLTRVEGTLIDKGKYLLASSSIAFKGMAEENAFSSMNELISSILQGDKDVVYGFYMDAKRQIWIDISPQNPNGKLKPLSIANDSMSLWADTVSMISYKKIDYYKDQIFEFAAPVYTGKERAGTIRFGISAARMKEPISKLEEDFIFDIFKYFSILIAVMILVLIYNLRKAKKHADAITEPLDSLTKAANTISKGDYNTVVNTITNDEIGDLASDFEKMRQTIKLYTENLGQMVEERTQQLNDSLKEQLIQANKLVTLGTLVAGLAHEVNNPNNSILLSAGALEEIWKGIRSVLNDYAGTNGDFKIGSYAYNELDEELPLLITRILNNSRRIKSIVEDLKNFSRKDYSVVKADMDVNRTIQEAIGIIESEIKKYTSHFKVKLQQNLPSIKGNQQQIEQALVNLIQNSCHALESRDQEICISSELDQDNAHVIISVEDNGIGMDESTLENLLKSFFTTKHGKGGTGLGLFVTSRIIKEHNGTLQFKSEPGKGTLAKITIPVTLAGGTV